MKRIVAALVAASLLTSAPAPSRGADPLDPAGHPVSSDSPPSVESSTLIAQQTHATFQRGDVFVAVSNGRVQWHLPDGTLNKVLDTNEGGFTTGMAFDDRGHLFLTGFQTNKIYEFDTTGTLVGTFKALDGLTDCQPESIVFDAAGNMYVGQAGCSDDVLKFAPDGTMLDRYNVAVEDRGSDWIDLEPDQCTLRYTSEGQRVLQYDVCEDVQLDDWGGGLTTSYALRNLPDNLGDPALVVASTQDIRGMNFGETATRYDAPGEDCWFALNLDPDAMSFWSADFCSSNVYRFHLNGDLIGSFNTGTGTSTVFGLAVFGELSTGTVRDCSSEDLSGAFGEVLPDAGERTTVRYDARFLVDQTRDLFAAEARSIAEKIQERAERALDYYGTDGLGAADPGLGFALPETLLIEISCSLNFGVVSIDPPTDGFVGEPGVIQLRLSAVQNALAAAAISNPPFQPGDAWNDPGAGWKNLIDHEVFHAAQYAAPNGDLRGRYQFDGHTMIESPARLAQDLFPDTDDLAASQYLTSVANFAQNKPTVDRRQSDGAYDGAAVLQFWGERFGPDGEANLERRVADFLKELISAPGPQVKAYDHAIGGDALAALRDYYLAHYGLRAGNISAGENAAYAILDAEVPHGGGAGLVPAYEAMDVAPPLDLSAGSAEASVPVEPWAGNIVEITNIPDDATHVALTLDSGLSVFTTDGFLSAIVAVNPGDEFLIDPQLMPAGPNVFAPVETRVPVIGRTRLFVAFVNGNIGGVEYLISADAVRGQVGMQFTDPTGNDPHRIQSATGEPIRLEVVPTVDGQPVPGDLPRSAFQVNIGGLNASVATADFRAGEYHLKVWAPAGLGAGTYDMALTFADTAFGVPGGLVIEEDAPPPTQIVRSASLGDLGQGDTASTEAIVTPGAQIATFGITWTGSDFDLILTSPSGRTIGEDSTDPDVTVTETPTSVTIAVTDPEGGTWQLGVVGAIVSSPQPVTYEVSETGAPLFGELFVADQSEAGLPLDATFAWSEPDGAVISGEMVATVTDPTGTIRRFPLHDDGANRDAGSADGVYGARLWATEVAGTYQIVVTASGTTLGGAPVQRQASTAITLGPKVDTDGDGVADAAEPLFGLDQADPGDGATDHDGDGLGLAEELAAGTDPAAWDTDDGGESDPSELAAGRDPREASDDADVEDALIGAVPLDGRLVRIEVRTVGGIGSVQVYRLTSGVRTDLGLHPGSGATITDGPLTAGEYSYLAVAIADDGAESGPFVAGPVTAGDDVTPPDFRTHLNGGRWEVTDPEVSVTFTDLTEAVEEMRLANSEAELASAAWVPFSGFTTVTIPAEAGQHFVYAQVRDAAGNESAVRASFVFLVDDTPPVSEAGPLDASYSTETIEVPYTASDDLSGVASVELWWRYRLDESGAWNDWALGPTGTNSPLTFTFSNGDGFYEFYSVAVDNERNREAPPAAADAATQAISVVAAPTTERVTVSSAGAQGNAASGGSKPSAISDDGRYVVYVSDASNLVAGDTNGASDVFVHDRQTGETTRVSVASDGSQANALSGSPAISGDGRSVSFASSASNLVAGDTNGQADVFVHDRQTGATTRVSVASGGAQANGASGSSSLSDDGRYVAFASSASNLVSGDTNKKEDVFVHDRQTGATARVSVTSAGAQATGVSTDPAISDDGRYVAFASDAKDLVANDGNRKADIFVHDRQTGATTRVSLLSSGQEANAGSEQPAISGDGRYVAFVSFATNLVPNDTNQAGDVFVHDRQTGETTRVSVTPGGGNPDDRAFNPSISDDGRYVGFASKATNLVAGSPSNLYDAYVRDRQEAVTLRVSIADDGSRGNSHSGQGSVELSGNGRHVVFDSVASNLVPDDTNGVSDVFVRADFGGG